MTTTTLRVRMCARCGETKRWSQFFRTVSGSGLSTWCRACLVEAEQTGERPQAVLKGRP